MVEAVLSQLREAAQAWADILGPDFVGAYVTGSICLGAFEPGSSDVDVLVVVRKEVERPLAERAARLAIALGHELPAEGLEFVLLTSASAAAPEPRFVAAASAGETWEDAIEFDEEDGSLCMDITICHRQGITLAGPPASEVFSPASDDQLRRALRGGLEWHRRWILDPHHDPGGQNSVLNACRAWRWAETGVLGSKRAGGEWAIARGGPEDLILGAIDLKRGETTRPLDPAAIDRFLQSTLQVLAE